MTFDKRKEVTMKELSRGAPNYVFDGKVPPVLRVEPGELFVVETEDNLTGFIKTERDLTTIEALKPHSDFIPPKYNPLNGPIFVKGAQRGDLLGVTIHKILVGEQGASCLIPGFGPLANYSKWPELGEAHVKIFKHIAGRSGTTEDGKAVYNDEIQWDLNPFVGTIGVAPEFEVESSLLGQGVWGGNWDCRDITTGSTIYLNCYHEGALLFLGDVHATQGDGEWTGVANEARAEVTLSCQVLKDKKIPYARIEKEESIVQFAP
jgi:acetamidase/formamidase